MVDETSPLAVDIDGTLTREDDTIDPRIFSALRMWEGPVVVATGKAFPYPIALCHFIGLDYLVIAENGGILATTDAVDRLADPSRSEAAVVAMEKAGYSVAWPEPDLVNRWRETEIAIRRINQLAELREIAGNHGAEIVDSGYAYHVKVPTVSKGAALERLADRLSIPLASFIAIGDSENDLEMFSKVGYAVAVANAHEDLKALADDVTREPYADGTVAALKRIHSNPPPIG